MIYDYLVTENNRIKTSFKFYNNKLTLLKTDLGFEANGVDRTIRITNINDIITIFRRGFCISNISSLKGSIVLNKLYLDQTVKDIIDDYAKFRSDVRFIRLSEPDIEMYISKLILKGYKYKLCFCGAFFILYNDTTVCFISYMPFILDNCIDFRGYHCSKLYVDSFDLSCRDTLEYFFAACTKLQTIYLKDFNTEFISTMKGMFCKCVNLENLCIDRLDMSNCESIQGMFGFCKSLKLLDLSLCNTYNITDIRSLFLGCILLEYINMSTWSFDSKICVDFVFQGCTSLKKVLCSSELKRILCSCDINMGDFYDICEPCES